MMDLHWAKKEELSILISEVDLYTKVHYWDLLTREVSEVDLYVHNSMTGPGRGAAPELDRLQVLRMRNQHGERW